MKTSFQFGLWLLFAATLLAPAVSVGQVSKSTYRKADQLRSLTRNTVFKSTVQPNWFDDDSQFWYRNEVRGQREFIVVNATKGTRSVAFDHARLAKELSSASGGTYTGDKLPFDTIQFSQDGKSVSFTVEETNWKCDLSTYQCLKVSSDEAPPRRAGTPPRSRNRSGRNRQGRNRRQQRSQGPRVSPDGKWSAFIKESNLYIQSVEDNNNEIQLTTDGSSERYYGAPTWSPDSSTIVSFLTTPGDPKEVYLVESSPRGGGRANLRTRNYALPGDKFTSYQATLFNVSKKEKLEVSADPIDFGRPRLRWNKDGNRFTYEQTDRGHGRFRVVEVDCATGAARHIVDEKTDTFIDGYAKNYITYTQSGTEIIRTSEMDGWNHLYLYDVASGTIKNQITKGNWLVRGVDRIDEEKRQIWFRAVGLAEGEDPYHIHYCRVNFDGSGFTRLTMGNGTHTVSYSPNREYLIDTYSRVDMAPVHELRRVSDGSLVIQFESADMKNLLETGVRLPEVFHAKGRDGKTDIWGLICRPTNMDPTKKYPVLEFIYAGPHGAHVPKSFRPFHSAQSMAELGFIVVQIDGMGTNFRSKAFHDVCWQNLKDAGFPDRILWMKEANKKYPYIDISRVGIYGTSAGGQNAMGALLFHPEFYDVAVASCGCHDNRMDKASWNEQWMGYPVGPHYAESSNVDNAHRLQGKLLLIVGELDTNVPPESTLRVADALIKANKDFDYLAIPGMGHSGGGSYGERRRRDFFIKHLQGVETPDWNQEDRR
ncbi:MAG: prolyl oligopeptidase family serine peptidase [Pirellulaceae bacterium]|nr:prolyl oligopeptidase family serine peptidase [Pirellulaceae bacterium]